MGVVLLPNSWGERSGRLALYRSTSHQPAGPVGLLRVVNTADDGATAVSTFTHDR